MAAAAAFAAATASGFSLPMEGGADELLSPPPRLRRDRGGESDSDSASLEDAEADPSLGESSRIVTRLPFSRSPLLPDDPPRDEPFDAEPSLRGGDGDVDRRL
jgi:hypothetical protein